MIVLLAINYEALLLMVFTWIAGGAFGLLGSTLFKALLLALGFTTILST